MKRSSWLKPKIEEPKLPKMPAPSKEDDYIVPDRGPEDSENQFSFGDIQPNESESTATAWDITNSNTYDYPQSTQEPLRAIPQSDPSIVFGFSRLRINGQILASFPAEQIEGMSPRNINLGPGSPIYIGEDINPIGYVVSLVSNFDYNHGNGLTRQIVASIDRVFIQI